MISISALWDNHLYVLSAYLSTINKHYKCFSFHSRQSALFTPFGLHDNGAELSLGLQGGYIIKSNKITLIIVVTHGVTFAFWNYYPLNIVLLFLFTIHHSIQFPYVLMRVRVCSIGCHVIELNWIVVGN